MIPAVSNEPTIDDRAEHKGPVSALLDLTSSAGFLRSTDGRFYVQVRVGGRPDIFMLRSAAFRDWLIDGYFRACRAIPSEWSMRRVMAALEAIARFEGGSRSIFVRVGHEATADGNGSASYLDLADPSGQAVKIGPDGWSVLSNSPVHFRRPDGHLPLPVPTRDGSIELLRPYVNLTDRDFRLLIVWMAAAIRPVGPHPILVLHGQQGSAKSTLAKIVRMLIDPQTARLLVQPRTTRDLMISAVNGWLLAFDNIGAIPDWLSDGLCLLATGGALAGQASFTSGERTVFHAQRPVILNGIEEFVRRSDLIDRSVFLRLPPIAPCNRRCEDEFWRAFNQDYPRILGGLLDTVAGGLRELPSVRLSELPRMADFAMLAEAVGQNLAWPAETALSDYIDNRQEATITQLEESAVGAVLLDLAPEFMNNWSGTPSELFCELTALAGEKGQSPLWPKSPARLTFELCRIAPQLGVHGIIVNVVRGNRGRVISLTRNRFVPRKRVDMRNPLQDNELGR